MKRYLTVLIFLCIVSTVHGAHFAYYAGGFRAYYEVYVQDPGGSEGPFSQTNDKTTSFAAVERYIDVPLAFSYVYDDIGPYISGNSIYIRSQSIAEGAADTDLSRTISYGLGRTQHPSTYGIYYKIMPDANESMGDGVMVYYNHVVNVSATGTTYAYLGGPWDPGMDHLAITRGQLPPVTTEPDIEKEVLRFSNLEFSNSSGNWFSGVHSFPAEIGDVIGIFVEHYTEVNSDWNRWGPLNGSVLSELSMILSVTPVLLGDVDSDEDVDFYDMALLAENWLVDLGGEPPVDEEPPTPDPMAWALDGEPEEVHLPPYGTWDYGATMTAATATDASGVVQYYFECTSDGGFSSTWQSSQTWTVKVGRTGQGHTFHVKARDLYGNETGWSPEVAALP